MRKRNRADAGLLAAINATRTTTDLAKAIGTTPQAVSLWDRIPHERVFDVERATGVPREILRPDLFNVPRPKRLRQSAHA